MTRLTVALLVLAGCGAATTQGGTAGVVVGDAGVVDPTTLAKFSFFVTSQSALVELSGSANGFGGDLRFGETGAGAGLRGADKLCATIAERSMPGAGQKGWRAFLSVTADATGAQVNAVDRLGAGPWYDRLGRVVATSKATLLGSRPAGADSAIVNDLPNETGAPNSKPDGTSVDNHDTLTGSTTSGTLSSATATCADWTSTTASGKPRVGHAFPRAGGTSADFVHWLSAHDAPGCGAGINTSSTSMGQGSTTVGGAGGYGGFYCFADVP
jgi:hypothetical protein